MKFPKYDEYKESDVEWLGSVPRHWSVVRVKDVARVVNGYPFDSKLFEPDGLYPLVRIRDLDASESATRYSGEFVAAASVSFSDVLIGMDGDFNVGRWLGHEVALLNQRMCCVRTSSPGLSVFLRHALPFPLKAINDVTYSTTVKHLSAFDVEKTRIALPPPSELAKVAAFLDRETARIDALIAEQERLLELLAEKRQAVISHAVTKGLNPDAPMKDSGVAWLGEVPAHWTVSPLKSLAKIGNGSTPNRDTSEYWAEEGFPWLNSSVVNQARVTESDQFVTQLALDQCHLPLIDPPAILVGITGQGKTRGMATSLGFKATVSQHVAYVKPRGGALLDSFLLRVFEAIYDHLRIESDGAGSTKGAITCEQIGNIRIPLPSIDEQASMSAQLASELATMDKLGVEAEKAIALLSERRSALIAAAVTGQIDVREAS